MAVPTRPRRRSSTPRDPWHRLHAALVALGQGRGELLRHSEKPWASITFSGTCHALTMAFCGADAVASGEAFIAALPEHEFQIAGQLVADAAVTSIDHVQLPEPRLTVQLELLLLEDG